MNSSPQLAMPKPTATHQQACHAESRNLSTNTGATFRCHTAAVKMGGSRKKVCLVMKKKMWFSWPRGQNEAAAAHDANSFKLLGI